MLVTQKVIEFCNCSRIMEWTVRTWRWSESGLTLMCSPTAISWVGCSRWVWLHAIICILLMVAEFTEIDSLTGYSNSSRWHLVGHFGDVGNNWDHIRPSIAEFHWMLVGCVDFGCADLQRPGHLVRLENMQNARNARIQMGKHSRYLIYNG